MVYLGPDFDTIGIHDPSVWLWAKYSDINSQESVSVRQSAIKFAVQDGVPAVSCDDEAIATFMIYDINGKLLKSAAPNSNVYMLPRELSCDSLLVVEVTTASHKVSKKLIY